MHPLLQKIFRRNNLQNGEKSHIAILTVNYNTAGLLQNLLQSIDTFCPHINIYIVDGSDKKKEREQVKSLCRNRANTTLFPVGRNIHHGPGLHYGIKRINSTYILLIDTDSILIKEGLIEHMLQGLNDGYGIGPIEYVNKNGWNVPKERGIPYLHTRCALIAKDQYLAYKPAIKHGAPMIRAMIDIFDRGDSEKLKHFEPLDEYYVHLGRGTVSSTGGYNLESRWELFKKRTKSRIKRVVFYFKK